MVAKKQSIDIEDLEHSGLNLPTPEELAEETPAAPGGDKLSPDDLPEGDKVASSGAVDWQDRYLRLSAEFDNFRKRTLKEKMDLVATGGEDVLKAVITVVDDFERALKAMATRTDIEAETEGVRLIYQKFLDILKAKGVAPIEALGARFDDNFHDAIARIPAPTPEQKGCVVDVVQTGYMIGDKVLRFARVVVGE